MKRLTLSAALLLLAATSLPAQQTLAYEAGVFAQYSHYDHVTLLKDGVGAGARFGVYIFKNFELEYEGDFNGTSSSKVGNLTALNNRINGIFYWPLNDKWRLLAGGGFTGTQYHTDTTHNRFDSGGNALIGCAARTRPRSGRRCTSACTRAAAATAARTRSGRRCARSRAGSAAAGTGPSPRAVHAQGRAF
jgi:hypothetical protein